MVSSGEARASPRSVVQRATPWRCAISATFSALRPTRMGSTSTREPSDSSTPPWSRMARMERTRCCRYPIRPVMPFMMMPSVVAMVLPLWKALTRTVVGQVGPAQPRRSALEYACSAPAHSLSAHVRSPGSGTARGGVTKNDLALDPSTARRGGGPLRDHGHRLGADLLQRQAHRGQRRGDVAEGRDVVEAGQCDVLGEPQPPRTAGRDGAYRHDVVHGEHALDVRCGVEELSHGGVPAVAREVAV